MSRDNSGYAKAYAQFTSKLADANVMFARGRECRQVYIRTIEEDITKVFKMGDESCSGVNISFAPEEWCVTINERDVELKDNFLAIGTTREIGNRHDDNFYQFIHTSGEPPDVSRVHCVLYFYKEFVAVVDLWSYNGTDVVLQGRRPITSRSSDRKVIKIMDSGVIVLRNCATSSNILVKRKKVPTVEREEMKECIACMDAETTHVIIPCGHKCLCGECSKNFPERLLKCPMCRDDIGSVIQVFET